MHYHTADGVPYWDESVYYQFTAAEIDALEEATYALDKMCLAAVEHVIDHDLSDRFLIPREYRDFIRHSWDQRRAHDLRPLRSGLRRPVSAEAAGVQRRHAHRAVGSGGDPVVLAQGLLSRDAEQFNSIHERLLEVFQTLRGRDAGAVLLHRPGRLPGRLHDRQLSPRRGHPGGLRHRLPERRGHRLARRPAASLPTFGRTPSVCCFKLYPWEWMQRDEFGPHLPARRLPLVRAAVEGPLEQQGDPAGVVGAVSAKARICWRPRFEPLPGGNYVQKPILGREGANIQIFEHGRLVLRNRRPLRRSGRLSGSSGPCRASTASISRDRQLDRQRLGLRHRHPRGREPDHRQPQPLCAAPVSIGQVLSNPMSQPNRSACSRRENSPAWWPPAIGNGRARQRFRRRGRLADHRGPAVGHGPTVPDTSPCPGARIAGRPGRRQPRRGRRGPDRGGPPRTARRDRLRGPAVAMAAGGPQFRGPDQREFPLISRRRGGKVAAGGGDEERTDRWHPGAAGGNRRLAGPASPRGDRCRSEDSYGPLFRPRSGPPAHCPGQNRGFR